MSEVAPDRKQLYQQAKSVMKNRNTNPKCKGIGELTLLDFWNRQRKKIRILQISRLHWQEYNATKNDMNSELKELPDYLEKRPVFEAKA